MIEKWPKSCQKIIGKTGDSSIKGWEKTARN